MKKLFPFTMNIKNYHLERFIHCNIHVLNQVMEKVKIRKSTFIQYQLLNRIMSSVQRLDKDIDSELFKIQRMREISLNVEKKMKINLKVKMKISEKIKISKVILIMVLFNLLNQV